MEITTGTRKIEIPLEEIRKTIPGGCAICPDLTSEFADVSVGVYEKDPGWNILVVRSEKGSEIVNQAVKEGYLETGTPDADNLKMLMTAALNKKRKGFQAAGKADLLNTSGENSRAAMRLNPTIIQQIKA
jgi:coenzyme F420 hydrogenase subunit beta